MTGQPSSRVGQWLAILRWTCLASLALSLVLGVLFLLLQGDVLPLGRGYWIGEQYGRLAVGREQPAPIEFSWPAPLRQEWWMYTGAFMYHGPLFIRGQTLLVLLSALALASAGLWTHRAVTTIRHRRLMRAVRCTSCGYDRAGLPHGAPCPECGTPHALALPSAS